jgi:hypothetical protein
MRLARPIHPYARLCRAIGEQSFTEMRALMALLCTLCDRPESTAGRRALPGARIESMWCFLKLQTPLNGRVSVHASVVIRAALHAIKLPMRPR